MGLNVDIIIEAFQIMDTPVQFLRTPWKRSFHYLKDGTVTALCAGFKTPERETFCIYPHEPLSMETNVIFSVGDTKHAINSLEDLRGLAVGVTAEYSYGPTFDAFEGLDKHILPTDTKLLGMLQHGRLDVAVGNRIVLNHLARELGTANNLKPLYVLNSMPQYLIFSRSLGQKAQEIADRFDQAMSQLHENGTLKRIRSHY